VKITAGRVAGFIKQPDPACRAVLVYGPDRGLVRERAEALAAGIVDDPDDPFRSAELTADEIKSDPARLGDEAGALSFTGGRRVVKVRGAGDGVAIIFKDFLDAPPGDALVVVEAGALAARSALRKLFEKAKSGAALACYGDEGRDLLAVITETLAQHGIKASGEALSYLQVHLGADRAVTRSELEKLALYKGEPGTVELDDAIACIDDSAASSLDTVIYAAAGGNWPDLDRALDRAMRQGISPVAVLRAMAGHMTRLHFAAALVAAGQPAGQAMKTLRPPIIFKFADRFVAQLSLWRSDRIAAALELLMGAELECKSTGQPGEVLCARALMRIAAMVKRPPMARSA
jgi:DNA polymerase-3 subunit delta